MTHNTGHINAHKRLSITIAAAGCALAIAACGSSTKPLAGGGPSQSVMLVNYARCMRSHGVPSFPDPSTTETANSFGIDGYNFDLPADLNTQSPAYESANTACDRALRSGSRGLPPGFAERAKRRALAHAQCMREHGVPNFPDPTISITGGGVTEGQSGGPGMNLQSPAFQQAQKACQPK